MRVIDSGTEAPSVVIVPVTGSDRVAAKLPVPGDPGSTTRRYVPVKGSAGLWSSPGELIPIAASVVVSSAVLK